MVEKEKISKTVVVEETVDIKCDICMQSCKKTSIIDTFEYLKIHSKW